MRNTLESCASIVPPPHLTRPLLPHLICTPGLRLLQMYTSMKVKEAPKNMTSTHGAMLSSMHMPKRRHIKKSAGRPRKEPSSRDRLWRTLRERRGRGCRSERGAEVRTPSVPVRLLPLQLLEPSALAPTHRKNMWNRKSMPQFPKYRKLVTSRQTWVGWGGGRETR